MGASNGKYILVVEDDETLNHLLVSQLEKLGYLAHGVAGFAAAQAALQNRTPDLALLDFKLPDASDMEALTWLREYCPVVMLTAYGSIDRAVQAGQAGAADYLIKPVSQGRLELAVSRALEAASLRRRLAALETQVRAQPGSGMIGQSPAFRYIVDLIGLVAGADTTVLIDGESGAGKELVARSIHERSPRHEHQLVTIDCCTLQETLLESELFGHERGAFTGADRRKEGLIEVAHGGTVLLDEIGEISPAIQAKLLRVLESGRFRRLGGTRDLSADARFLAATNKNLAELVKAGSFRGDLYYRLSAVVITVPPLRERREDILPIARHFLAARQFRRNVEKRFHPRTERVLLDYAWPGNIRELRNVVERGLLMSADAADILPEHLSLPVADTPVSEQGFSLSFDHEPTLKELRQHYVQRVLAACGGNKARAARTMGISERNLYRLVSGPADIDGE